MTPSAKDATWRVVPDGLRAVGIHVRWPCEECGSRPAADPARGAAEGRRYWATTVGWPRGNGYVLATCVYSWFV